MNKFELQEKFQKDADLSKKDEKSTMRMPETARPTMGAETNRPILTQRSNGDSILSKQPSPARNAANDAAR